MALQVFSEGERVDLVFTEFDTTNKTVVCHGLRNAAVEVGVSYPLDVHDLYSADDFTVAPLSKFELREEDIYQVYDKKFATRIGWIIPVAALDSLEHSYVENVHFLRYAAISLRVLLDTETSFESSSPDISGLNYLRFSDFFGEQTALLVVCRQKLSTLTNTIDCLIPGLAAYGFADGRTSSSYGVLKLPMKDSNGRANIHLLPKNTPNLPFIARVFGYLVPHEPAPLVRFFYLYQVVELMMEVVYADQQQELRKRLVNEEIDRVQLQELLDTYVDLSKERRRLSILQSNYLAGNLSADISPARDACNTFLIASGHESLTDFFEAFYRTRNVIFHQYYNITDIESLDLLVDELILILPDIVYTFVTRIQTTS